MIDAVTGATVASTVAIGGYLGLLRPFLGSSLDGRSGVPITALPSSELLRIARGAALTARLSVLTDPSLLTRRRTV